MCTFELIVVVVVVVVGQSHFWRWMRYVRFYFVTMRKKNALLVAWLSAPPWDVTTLSFKARARTTTSFHRLLRFLPVRNFFFGGFCTSSRTGNGGSALNSSSLAAPLSKSMTSMRTLVTFPPLCCTEMLPISLREDMARRDMK